jgi:hypothetical protein
MVGCKDMGQWQVVLSVEKVVEADSLKGQRGQIGQRSQIGQVGQIGQRSQIGQIGQMVK